MDVEVLVSRCEDALESLLVLGCGCPRRVGRWSGDHHEEWLRVGLVVQELQGEVGLTHTESCHLLPLPSDCVSIGKLLLVDRQSTQGQRGH